ncbi:DNA mismatch repair [Micractinium conductrix]|uniref:DNA mismatch repair n=1 Tax=Micractinium conductrix TaxID=554055 RepID=A0A2P6VP57_9CHLO|nr:DNA mismatch repair [Micractinium conductrix]|eukprot:PSC75882.1 DNA mismatch repair [Micractinium conductrix]
MCGPTGSSFCLGLSIFAMLFLSVLAMLIGSEYPYAGEWFEAKPETPGGHVEPLHEQRDVVVKNLWATVGIYAAFGVVSGMAVCVHKVRGNL